MLTIEMSTTLRKYDIIEQINSRDLAVGDTTAGGRSKRRNEEIRNGKRK